MSQVKEIFSASAKVVGGCHFVNQNGDFLTLTK